MLNCENPVLLGGAFPCGQCPPCLSRRRRTWAHRIIMEMYAHDGNSTFITLTYNQAPTLADGAPTLEASHLQQFLKRLRKNSATSLRYFGVGEYGDKSGRPHYHLALFGLHPCTLGPIVRVGKGLICQCKTCSVVRLSWGFGHIMVGSLSEKSAMYIAGYVVKKMTHSKDPRLDGAAPEFARMSLRPGLGATALDAVVSVLVKYKLPVPCGLRHGSKVMPMGRYIRRKIAEKMCDGSPEAMAQALDSSRAIRENLAAVCILRKYSWDIEKNPLEVLRQITPKFQPPPPKERSL